MAPTMHEPGEPATLTWADLRAREAPCLRCGWKGPIAGPLSPAGRARVAAVFTGRLDMEVFRLIRDDTGCGLSEAKGLFQHLVKKARECHWCRAPISDAE